MGEDEGSSTRESPLEGRSANHFEIAFTPYEFLIDFGQAYEKNSPPMIHTRVIMTPHAAETFLQMLTQLIGEYKRAGGPVMEGTN